MADLEGAQQASASPLQFDRLLFFKSHFVSECLKNKAQIARESIKYHEALDPDSKGFGLRARGVLGRT